MTFLLATRLDADAALKLGFVVLDIVIVWYVIYRVLLLLRGTRAIQVLFGLMAVILVYFLTRPEWLNLTTLNWLLERFIGSFILVVVVLFQHDIRRGLTTVARKSWSRFFTTGRETLRIEELVRACGMLAQSGLGGLIVIERTADLSQYTDEAVQIDAVVTKDLLFAIFNPAHANPLHDGAVVIRGDRVVCAGAFLPLTSNPRIPKHLGTRHRAGIGLSEDTDAVVIIVSEETSETSIAVGGNLMHGLSGNSLRRELQNLLIEKPDARTPAATGAAE